MNKKICKISLFSAILACVSAVPGWSAIKVKNANRSYAGAYQQINAMRYEQEQAKANAQIATTASAVDNLPVAVEDARLANSIINNDAGAPSVSTLEACSMIYPNGIFKWAEPESGIRLNAGTQCVAVVELRDTTSNAVLATTTVAAGDAIKCNIDYFPVSGYNMAALSRVELPADNAPTMEDVEKVMNEEQKQNAGLKIVAAALVGGVAGNLLAPKEAGDTKLFGASKTQLKDTAIAATAGAGIMAASTYSGKVAGDTIKSTAVNAASGMIIGNMLAGANGGDSVLFTTKCKPENGSESDCIVGQYNTLGETITFTNTEFYIINKHKQVRKCNSSEDQLKCPSDYKKLINIKIKSALGGAADFDNIFERDTNHSQDQQGMKRYRNTSETNSNIFTDVDEATSYDENDFFVIESADTVSGTRPAYAVFSNLPNKLSGYKLSDWKNLKELNPTYYYRNSDGSVSYAIEEKAGDNKQQGEFTPSTRDAEDGGLVDLSNKARLKGTVAGGAVGGTLGGIAGYAGAQDEIQQRYLSAIREYGDSLSNFWCATGGRPLSKYNEYVEIPEPRQTE